MSNTVAAIAQLPTDLREAFDALAADAAGPFGPKPLARLMATHLVLFTESRELGASWAQIAGLLASKGIVGGSGAFTAEVVRATYARIAADATPRKRTKHNATKRNEADGNAAKGDVAQRNATRRDETNSPDHGLADLFRRAEFLNSTRNTR